ncbi:hypothetical protein E2C01_071970 [Portunus trituberculatus]|uniref:Uncharacterized protein n=1 Tax=Portunus trituberculatus TaxID=210409 RepID=A0A5B7I5A3_PORTR|nr:hypothetical protein [Portunus trituberculatus]
MSRGKYNEARGVSASSALSPDAPSDPQHLGAPRSSRQDPRQSRQPSLLWCLPSPAEVDRFRFKMQGRVSPARVPAKVVTGGGRGGPCFGSQVAAGLSAWLMLESRSQDAQATNPT